MTEELSTTIGRFNITGLGEHWRVASPNGVVGLFTSKENAIAWCKATLEREKTGGAK